MSLNNIIYNCEKFKASLDYQWNLRVLQHEMDILPKLPKLKKIKVKLKNDK